MARTRMPIHGQIGRAVKRNTTLLSKSRKSDKKITDATHRGEVFGGEKFHQKVGQLLTRPTKLTSHGGDRKSGEYKKQAG